MASRRRFRRLPGSKYTVPVNRVSRDRYREAWRETWRQHTDPWAARLLSRTEVFCTIGDRQQLTPRSLLLWVIASCSDERPRTAPGQQHTGESSGWTLAVRSRR